MTRNSPLAPRGLVAATLLATVCICSSAQASLLWVGYDTTTAVQRWTTSGVFQGTFGMGAATGTALDGAFAWTVQPGGSDSVITKYNATQIPLATIHFSGGIENGNGFPSWIEDMASGSSHSLWLSGYNGIIYHIDSSGNILSHFDSGHTYPGIEVVGTSVYTTSGISGDSIFKYDMSGTLLSTITVTGMSGIGGLAYDPTDNTFWAGTFGAVDHAALDGTLLGSLSLPGAFHDGLAIGDLSSGVPELSTWMMMLIGFAGVGLRCRGGRPAAIAVT
jgi:hypothetical protein